MACASAGAVKLPQHLGQHPLGGEQFQRVVGRIRGRDEVGQDLPSGAELPPALVVGGRGELLGQAAAATDDTLTCRYHRAHHENC
jgi:hypothetical protein